MKRLVTVMLVLVVTLPFAAVRAQVPEPGPEPAPPPAPVPSSPAQPDTAPSTRPKAKASAPARAPSAAKSAAPAADTLKMSRDDRDFLERVNRPVVVKVPGMSSVKVQRNRSYSEEPATSLADVYLPWRETRRPHPMVLILHGSVRPGFPVRPKDWGLFRSYGRLFAASGLATVVINHRAGYPMFELEAASGDVRAALRWMRRQAKAWYCDPDRIAIVAFSGGGPLLVEGMRDPMLGAQALVGMYPILDVRKSAMYQSQLSATEVETYSPAYLLTQVAATMPPTMVVRAGSDGIPDLLIGIDQFMANALLNQAPVTLINVPNGPHGFDNLEPTPAAQDAVNAMIAFLRRHLGLGG